MTRALFAVLCGVSIAVLAKAATDATSERRSARVELQVHDALLREALEQIERRYVDSPGDRRLIENAVRGMTEGLDAYSTYLDKSQFDDIALTSAGLVCGIGIDVGTAGSIVEVQNVMDRSPAAKADIRPGDVIVSIDGRAIGADSELARALLRGYAGKVVALLVRRPSTEQAVAYSLRRELLVVRSVHGEVLEAGYGYVQIASFDEATPEQLDLTLMALSGANRGPLAGLVLDLRDNPGGVLESAIAVADHFLDRGIIVTADGRTPREHLRAEARHGDRLKGAPMAVVVNGGSASASEVLAGALRDHARAVLVGSRTYGKGLIQSIIPLSQGAIYLTTARYFTPSGASIDGTGILPDLIIEPPNASGDPINRASSALTQLGNTKAPNVRDPAIRAALEWIKQQVRARHDRTRAIGADSLTPEP